MLRLPHDEADGVLEDEREEDADEDDQEGVPDRLESERDARGSADDEQCPHRHEELDAAGASGSHRAKSVWRASVGSRVGAGGRWGSEAAE